MCKLNTEGSNLLENAQGIADRSSDKPTQPVIYVVLKHFAPPHSTHAPPLIWLWFISHFHI